MGSGLCKDGLSHHLYSAFISKQFLGTAERHNPAIADDMVQFAAFNPQLRLRKVWKLSLRWKRADSSLQWHRRFAASSEAAHWRENGSRNGQKQIGAASSLMHLRYWCVVVERERVELEGTALHLSVDLWPSSWVWYWPKDSSQEGYYVPSSPAQKKQHFNVCVHQNPRKKLTLNNMSDLTMQTLSRIQSMPKYTLVFTWI